MTMRARPSRYFFPCKKSGGKEGFLSGSLLSVGFGVESCATMMKDFRLSAHPSLEGAKPVDARERRLVELARMLVRTPSLSGREGEVARLVKDTMRDWGFDEVWTDRYGSVVGTVRGKRPGRTVLMDGHIDTVDVPEPGRWTHDPYGGEIADGRIYGRGASDMKGSVAAMIAAAADFAEESGRNFSGRLCVSCTVHEECFEGVSSRQVSRDVRPDFVIVGEATNLALNHAQRGRAEIAVETRGVSCHSANPEKGSNAVRHMVAVIEEIERIRPVEHPLLGRGIYELTDIVSSPYPGASMVPGACRITLDRRTLPGETPESVLAPVEEAIQRARARVPQLEASAAIVRGSEDCYTGERLAADRFFPAWLLEPEDELVQRALAGLESVGIHAPLSHFSFCTNGSHFCGEAGIPTVGFGPSLENLAHVVDEYVEIESLLTARRGFYGIARELTRRGEQPEG